MNNEAIIKEINERIINARDYINFHFSEIWEPDDIDKMIKVTKCMPVCVQMIHSYGQIYALNIIKDMLGEEE